MQKGFVPTSRPRSPRNFVGRIHFRYYIAYRHLRRKIQQEKHRGAAPQGVANASSWQRLSLDLPRLTFSWQTGLMSLESSTELRRQHFSDRFSNLVQEFRVHFQIQHALTERARLDAYRIRHQVYCEEFGWEPTYSSGLESDEFDPHSAHILLRNTTGGDAIGSLRLVHAMRDGKSVLLPMERAYGCDIEEVSELLCGVDRRCIAEVSRLAITSDYRRRRTDKVVGVAEIPKPVPDPKHDRYPFLTMGLYLGGLSVARRSGLTHLVMLLEPKLARHLNTIGFRNRVIGEPLDHHGIRVPALLEVDATIDRFAGPLGNLFESIETDIMRPSIH
jgi:N-acyl amino acid synthase of PEP-CTERM/exosortase system